MPTYEYQCQDCGHVFELLATLKQKAAGLQPECPQCHSKRVRQAFRSLTLIRNGGGGSSPVSPGGCCAGGGTGCCG
ncbi:MAG: FmdB family zinc ribbon protein [Anaerolineae bacterium]